MTIPTAKHAKAEGRNRSDEDMWGPETQLCISFLPTVPVGSFVE